MVDHYTLRHNIAYGAFLVCGLVALLVSSLSLIPMGERMATILGLLLVMPLFMVALFAMAVGFVYTILLRDHTPVLVLGLVTAVVMALIVTDVMPPWLYNAGGWLYGIGVTLVCVHWFVFGRWAYRRARDEADAAEAAAAEAAELAEAEQHAAEEERAVRQRIEAERAERQQAGDEAP